MSVKISLKDNNSTKAHSQTLEYNGALIIPDFFDPAPQLIAIQAFPETDGSIVATVRKRVGAYGLELYRQHLIREVRLDLAIYFSSKSTLEILRQRESMMIGNIITEEKDPFTSRMVVLSHVPDATQPRRTELTEHDMIQDAIRTQMIPFVQDQTLN